MKIQQFYDKNLSHASYAIVSNQLMAVVDPTRDPQQYYDFAKENNAKIIYVLETHPHADFVSSHLQIHTETSATVLTNSTSGVSYPYQSFDHNGVINFGSISIKALHTPGHSPDSNSYLFTDPETGEEVLFTGDFLFIGDVGRPDLRESVGNIQESRYDLAKKMYHSIHSVLPTLSKNVIIYPTHGAGTLCGKNLSKELYDTLSNQRKTNWALQNISESEFIAILLEDQPYIPKYFTHCVETNRKGAHSIEKSTTNINYIPIDSMQNNNSALVVDTRIASDFRKGSYGGAINIPAEVDDKFETWIGSIFSATEKFYIISESKEKSVEIVKRIVKIGYEDNILGFCIADNNLTHVNVYTPDRANLTPDQYYIIDVRQENEHCDKNAFQDSMNIPLFELRDRVLEIKTEKPVLVHCAGGYRSAIGSSIISKFRTDLTVFDLSTEITNFII